MVLGETKIKFLKTILVALFTYWIVIVSVSADPLPVDNNSTGNIINANVTTGTLNNVLNSSNQIAGSIGAVLTELPVLDNLSIVSLPLVSTSINLTSLTNQQSGINESGADESSPEKTSPINELSSGSIHPLQKTEDQIPDPENAGMRDKEIAATAIAAIISISVLKYFGLEEVMKRLRRLMKLLFFIPARYEHISDGNPNETRDKVFDFIEKNPGVHMRGISPELSIPMGTLRYHLNVLEDFGRIISKRHWGFKRYYPNKRKQEDGFNMLAAYQKSTSGDILQLIKTNPGICRSEIANRLNISGPAVTWHISRLETDNLIRKIWSGKVVRYYLTAHACSIAVDEKEFVKENTKKVAKAARVVE